MVTLILIQTGTNEEKFKTMLRKTFKQKLRNSGE